MLISDLPDEGLDGAGWLDLESDDSEGKYWGIECFFADVSDVADCGE